MAWMAASASWSAEKVYNISDCIICVVVGMQRCTTGDPVGRFWHEALMKG